MDAINYSIFKNSGVVVSDTFDVWRQKTNGTITRLNSIIDDVDVLYNTDRTAIRYVTTDSPQSIIGTKTFSGGSSSSPVLKIDAGGLYYDTTDSSIASTVSLKAQKLVNSGATIQLGALTYSVPTTNPAELSLLSKDGSSMGWTGYSSLISQIKNEASVNVVTTNVVLPVGTIQAYSSTTNIPTGWLGCTGGRFIGSAYPELAQLLLVKYGPAYTTETGNVLASNQSTYVATNWYTLPDLQGRIAIGAGTGNDLINATQTFALGTKGGKFAHTLINSEVPNHTHTMASGGGHTHQFNLQTINNYDSIVAFGRTDINSEIPNDTTGYATGGTVGANDRIITMATAGAHTHTINSTAGGGGAHSILQPYLVTAYIIKAKPDSVITSQIQVGSGINVVRGGTSRTFISLTDSVDSTLSVKHDSTLKINTVDSSLGLNNDAVNNSNIVNAAITPEKLSTHGPSWDLQGIESALYEGSGASRRRVATREWVNDIVVDGPVQSLVSKCTNARHTSASVQYRSTVYAYIDKDGVPFMAGYHIWNSLGPTIDNGGGYTPYPLLLDDGYEIRAVKLWTADLHILALGSNGKLYARGYDNHNVYNVSTYVSATTYYNWVVAFDRVYSYLNQNRTIVSVITSNDLDPYNIAVLDSAGDLWIAGANTFGQLGNGTTVATGDKAAGNKFEGAPVLTNVKEAIMLGSWNGTSHPVTIAAIQWTNAQLNTATLRTVGYGGHGQMGDGSSASPNTAWKTATLTLTASEIANCELYGNGSNQYTSILLRNGDGSLVYGWGYNSDFNLGVTPQQLTNTLPLKLWDSTASGPLAQRDRRVEKLYTGVYNEGLGATYILTAPLPTTGKREIWAAGRNEYNKWGTAVGSGAYSAWTNITPTTRPSNWSIEDFYVGQSWNQSTNNFIKWKIDNPDTDVYQLEASGWSGDYNTGTGLTTPGLTTWTRVNMRSSLVQAIVDLQNGRSHERARSYTYLLLNDGSLYYTGLTHYQCNPYGIEGYGTPNFVRIK